MKYISLLLLTFFTILTTYAQPAGYQVGQKVDNFSLRNNQDKTVSLNDYMGSKLVVVVFVNKNCPNGRIYGSRLRNLTNAYAGKGVTILNISSPISMETAGPEASALAKQVPAPAPDPDFMVLRDNDNAISAQFGATKIPEVFVLQNNNGNFILKYKGAIDDNPQLETATKDNYLRDALDALLANRPVAVTEKRAFGCRIKQF